MAFIKGVLLEEYNRFASKKADYEEKLLCNIDNERHQKLKKSLDNIIEDMTFIKNAFKGNGLNIEQELIQFIQSVRK